jgi:hypothetical protein
MNVGFFNRCAASNWVEQISTLLAALPDKLLQENSRKVFWVRHTLVPEPSFID